MKSGSKLTTSCRKPRNLSTSLRTSIYGREFSSKNCLCAMIYLENWPVLLLRSSSWFLSLNTWKNCLLVLISVCFAILDSMLLINSFMESNVSFVKSLRGGVYSWMLSRFLMVSCASILYSSMIAFS